MQKSYKRPSAAGKAINPVILAFTLKIFVINELSQKPRWAGNAC